MKAMADLNDMQGTKFTDEDFLHGEGVIWLNCEEEYISLISLWLLMEIQTCRKKGYYHIGFIEPPVVNCKNLLSKHQETYKNVYKYLSIQHYKAHILFPYNFGVGGKRTAITYGHTMLWRTSIF